MEKILNCKKCGKKLKLDWEKLEEEYFEKGAGLLGKGLCGECLEKEILRVIKKEVGND